MPALQIIQVGETPISSAKINLIIQALNGQGNTPVAITGINDPLAFALSLRNLDSDNGKVLIAYAADGVTELLRVDKNGVRLSPDGISQAGTIVTADAQQTLLQKTLVSPTIAPTGFGNADHAHADPPSGGQFQHGNLLSSGANSHAQLDVHLAAKLAAVHGVHMAIQAANLDLSSLTSTDGDIVIVKAWGAATITISASGTGGIVSSKNDPAGASGTGIDATYTINEGDSFLLWKQNNYWYIMA